MIEHNWDNFYKNKIHRPRKTLLKAIELYNQSDIKTPKFAMDLGCGSGVDTIELLKEDWSVIAIDREASAISHLGEAAPLFINDKLETRITSFEELSSLPSVYLINASFSLPFLEKKYFYKFWDIIVESLHVSGRFSGTF